MATPSNEGAGLLSRLAGASYYLPKKLFVPPPAVSGRRFITHNCLLGRSETNPVSSMASGLDASSLHPTCVALALCPLEQRLHQRHEPPVPLVLRWSTITA
jgi:hypothetical protein